MLRDYDAFIRLRCSEAGGMDFYLSEYSGSVALELPGGEYSGLFIRFEEKIHLLEFMRSHPLMVSPLSFDVETWNVPVFVKLAPGKLCA